MRNAFALGIAAFTAALALPALAQEESTYDEVRARAADHMIHGAALDAADQDLADRIVDEIAADKAVHNAPVTVAVNDGNVTLSGPTDNQHTVARIEDDAARVAGRAHVAPMV